MLPVIRHAILLLLLAASPAGAQSLQPVEHQWSHGTTLGLVGGVGTASDGTGAVLGGSLGWELTPRVGIDGTATWYDRQTGDSSFAATLSVHAGLTRSHALAPFVEGGFGMYIATFDPSETTAIPPFYADRMTGALAATFVDPAFLMSAGFDLFRTRHIAIRPTIGAVIAVHDARAYTVGQFTVRAEYHFEDHPARGSRRGR
jgi:hypothetical protein